MNLGVLCKIHPPGRILTKALLVMKLTIILLTVFTFYAHANGFSQTITWSGKNVSLEKVFSVIKKQTGYFVFYNQTLLKDAHKINLDVKDEDIEEVLKLCFKDQPLDYEIEHRTIVVTRKIVSEPEKIIADAVAQDTSREIKGTIRNEKGEAVSGATVLLAGTSIGTSADENGEFSLRIPQNRNQLIVSSVGYENQSISIRGSGKIGVILKAKLTSADDIVVVGYGSVKKSDLTGAVSSVSKKDIGDRQVSDVASLIQGKAAGVDVSQGTIRIRGITTFNSTDPLIVIDGFIGGNLATVNANDIENIEILKDASSTAIYGSRGANGVILITTKSGRKGPTKIGVSYYEGLSNTPKKLDVLNANQYTDYVLNILSNSGIAPTPKLLSGETRIDRTNWQDAIFKTGHNRELNLDFSGGSDNTVFFVGMGYRHTENPTYLGMKNDDVYFRNKNSFTVKKWLRFGNNFAFDYNSYYGGGEYGNPGNLDHAISAPQYFPIKDSSGEYSTSDRNTDIVEFANPITTAVHNHLSGASINYQAALWAEVEPIKGLVYKIQAGVSGLFGRTSKSNDEYTGGIAGSATLPTKLTKTNYYTYSPLIEQYLTYRHIFFHKHDFSIMVGNTWQNGASNGNVGVSGQGLDLAIQNVLTAPTNQVVTDDIGKYAYLSYFGRVNYIFDNKYLLTVNMRSDASPRFAPGNRWGTFPSVAIAWKLHEENFIKNLKLFDQLKLRAGWGKSGNDAIGEFRYLAQVFTQNVYAPFGPDGARNNGATVLNNASGDIKWESTETKSLGMDMAFFDNRLSITADYYDKETSGILFQVPRAASLGYGSGPGNGNAIVNAASMLNKGIEFQVGYRSRFGALNYSINVNYTHNNNKVTSLGDGSYLDGINRTDIGHPVGYFYGYVADGIFKSQKELDAANAAAQTKGFATYQLATTQPGDVRFVDVNGDGHVDNADRTAIGSPHPSHIYGLNINLDYKGFDFNVFFQGIAGSSIFLGDFDRTSGGSYVLNQTTYVLDRWQSESMPGNGKVPRAVIGDPAQNNRPSTIEIFSGNYLKIKQLSFGYTLSPAATRRIGLDNMRIYVAAYNYFSFDKYKLGRDPEMGGDNLNRGVDPGSTWPAPKLLSVGIQVKL